MELSPFCGVASRHTASDRETQEIERREAFIRLTAFLQDRTLRLVSIVNLVTWRGQSVNVGIQVWRGMGNGRRPWAGRQPAFRAFGPA